MIVLRIVFTVFALVALLNGLQMVFAADTWFNEGPPGVPHTGPFNGHFVRDLGVLFLVFAGAMAWGAYRPQRAYPVLLMTAAWLVGHALVHVVETAEGHLPAEHWRIDFLTVFLPAIIAAVLVWPPLWKRLTRAEPAHA